MCPTRSAADGGADADYAGADPGDAEAAADAAAAGQTDPAGASCAAVE